MLFDPKCRGYLFIPFCQNPVNCRPSFNHKNNSMPHVGGWCMIWEHKITKLHSVNWNFMEYRADLSNYVVHTWPRAAELNATRGKLPAALVMSLWVFGTRPGRRFHLSLDRFPSPSRLFSLKDRRNNAIMSFVVINDYIRDLNAMH